MTDRIPYPRGVRSHRDLDSLLGTLHMGEKQDFLTCRGPHKVTFVHLAAYSGNLRILERANDLGVDLNAVDGYDRSALHHAAFKGQVDVLKWLLDRPDGEKLLELKNLRGDTAPFEAIEGLHYDSSRISRKFNLRNVAALQLLVDRGANVNATNTVGFPPLFVAGYILVRNGGPDAAMWYEKVINILVSAGASVNLAPGFWVPGYKALDCAIVLESVEATRLLVDHGAYIVKRGRVDSPSIMTALHLAAAGRCPEILRILAEKVHSSSINVQNLHGMTPLHCAVQTGHPKNFRTLIDYGANLLATNFEGKTVLQVLFGNRERPVAYLTDCLNLHVKLTSDEIVELDFKVLLPQGRPQMEVISILIGTVPNMNEMTILQHPLLDAFLRLKWSKFRYFFFSLCILHASLLVALFWYAVILVQTNNDSTPPRWMLLPAIIQLAHNLLLFFTMPRYYVRQFEQWLSLVCGILSIGVFIAGEFIPDLKSAAPVEDQPIWLLNTVSIVILFAGIQLMLIIGRFPTSGFYTLMFFTVLKNVAKLFLVFACLILSFAFSFLIILHGENQFRSPWVMVVKTVVMMTGEYDYSDFLAATSKEQSMGKNTTVVVGGIIFLLFVMFASIVLMNLITALAVTDVQGLVKKGELLGLMKQVEFMAQFERVTAHSIFSSKWIPNCLKKMIKREIRNDLWLKRAWFRSHYLQFVYCPRCISEKLMKTLFTLGEKNRDSEKKSKLQWSREEESVDELTETVLDLQKQIRELEKENKFYRRRMELSGDEPENDNSEVLHRVSDIEPIDSSSVASLCGEDCQDE